MGSRAALDMVAKKKSPTLPGIEPQFSL